MGEKEELRRLIDRAWSLHDCISHDVAATENPLPLIRDSMKEVENTLILLQRMRRWQETDRQAAIARLEESRAMLVEKVAQYQQSGREVGVVEELNEFFGESSQEKGVETNIKSVLLNPCKWLKGFGVAMKLTLVLATISYASKFPSIELRTRNNSQTRTNVTISSRALDVFDGRG